MSTRFALDQSVVFGALSSRPQFMLVIHAIVERCDTIVWDREWLNRCYPTIQRHARTTTGLELVAALKQAFVWEGKMDQITSDPPPLPDESGIHRKDLWLVRLAVAAGACVVAEDAPLIEALCAKGIPCARPIDIIAT